MTTEAIELVRLSKEHYDRLEASLRQPVVSATTTAHEAGFLLGIQHVLRHLREGWVITQR